jgi:molecular chaperone DnaK
MAKYIGIDLGTTMSAIAFIKADGSPELLINSEGGRLTPSVILLDQKDKEYLVGEAARDGGSLETTIYNIKNYMEHENCIIEVANEEWTPTALSSLILKKLVVEAKEQLKSFKEVVITVPANYSEVARINTIQAAKLAGIAKVRLVNEPSAAAVYYAYAYGVQGRFLVFDMGGGTLDISVVELRGGTIQVLSSVGCKNLGGNLFTELLFEDITQEFKKKTNVNLCDSDEYTRKILGTVDLIKKKLSRLKKCSEHFISENGQKSTSLEITRERFINLIKPTLTKAHLLVEAALMHAKLRKEHIDQLILVGGSTRVPVIHSMLKEMFGQSPNACGHVDECVALGAALCAKNSFTIREISHASYGMMNLGWNTELQKEVAMNQIVIDKGLPLPTKNLLITYTGEPKDEPLILQLTQGEGTDLYWVNHLRHFKFESVRNLPENTEISLNFCYDSNQHLSIELQNRFNGNTEVVEVDLISYDTRQDHQSAIKLLNEYQMI